VRALLPICTAAALLAAGCGGGGGATIVADGSSTVSPFTTRAAESFQQENPDTNVTVGISGTGGGFERFCADETDLSDASRPIEEDEAKACADAGIEYVEIPVANDALTVIVNSENDWATCITSDELERMWEPGSKMSTWRDVRTNYPDEPLRLYGPGTDSGTFDFFTGAIVGEEGSSRADYQASEDDNVTVEGVAGERGGLGYLGFSYFEENQGRLKALAVDGGDGCVEPNEPNAQSGAYKPLSRPLFIYVKRNSLERPEVEAFMRHVLDNEPTIADDAQFVPLTNEQLASAKSTLEDAVGQ
jgi:phosphate transport system substrate-binding protein